MVTLDLLLKLGLEKVPNEEVKRLTPHFGHGSRQLAEQGLPLLVGKAYSESTNRNQYWISKDGSMTFDTGYFFGHLLGNYIPLLQVLAERDSGDKFFSDKFVAKTLATLKHFEEAISFFEKGIIDMEGSSSGQSNKSIYSDLKLFHALLSDPNSESFKTRAAKCLEMYSKKVDGIYTISKKNMDNLRSLFPSFRYA